MTLSKLSDFQHQQETARAPQQPQVVKTSQDLLERFRNLSSELSTKVVGQQDLINGLLISLLADGHVLIEGLPGLAKTRAVRLLSTYIEASFSRIQATADLQPLDILGSEILSSSTEDTFRFAPGPIFNNLVLIDEINRAPSKTQSALLEAMEEKQISVFGTSRKLPEPFFVLATQNPIESSGTEELPEAQLDRFFMKIKMKYPSYQDEKRILDVVHKESLSSSPKKPRPILLTSDLLSARKYVLRVEVSQELRNYIIALVGVTRTSQSAHPEIKKYIQHGCSPRGSICLEKCARARAWLQGKTEVSLDDVRASALAVLAHRIVRTNFAKKEKFLQEDIIRRCITLTDQQFSARK